jgi:hypothetical protein
MTFVPLLKLGISEHWVPNETRHHGSLQVGTLVLPLSGRFLCYQNGPPLTSSMPAKDPGMPQGAPFGPGLIMHSCTE